MKQSLVRQGRIFPVAQRCLSRTYLLGFSQKLGLSLVLMLFVGGAMMVQTAINTILQTIVEKDKRGRVMSFYSMAFLGIPPFRTLLAETLAANRGI